MRGKTLVSFKRNRGEKQKTLSIFGTSYNNEYNSLQKKLARDFYELLIKNIKRNTYGFKLAPSTLASRRSRGITSTVPFIDTEVYIKAIFVDGVSIQIDRGVHKPSNLLYTELFNILEFGRRDKNIPARPVFRNTQRDFAKIADKQLKELTSRYLAKGIKKKNRAINKNINIKVRTI